MRVITARIGAGNNWRP